MTRGKKSDRITKLSARRETEVERRVSEKLKKKVKKLLKKYLTKGFGCDIIVESPKSKKLRDGKPVIEN